MYFSTAKLFQKLAVANLVTVLQAKISDYRTFARLATAIKVLQF